MADENAWPAWYYGPDGKSAVFNSAEDVPAGWVTHPSLLEASEPVDTQAETAEPLVQPETTDLPAEAGRPVVMVDAAVQPHENVFQRAEDDIEAMAKNAEAEIEKLAHDL